MALTNRYSTGAAIQASFDFTDIDEGTGTVVYLPATGTDQNLMVKEAIGSNTTSSTAVTTSTSAVKVLDIDFDVQFNTAKVLKGLCLVSISHGISDVSTDAASYESFIIAKIRKWDGSSETEIANNQGDTHDFPNGNTTQSNTDLIEINIATGVKFKAGETLRLTIEQWGRALTGGDGHFGFGHDPQARVDSESTKVIADTETTKLEFQAKFRLFL